MFGFWEICNLCPYTANLVYSNCIYYYINCLTILSANKSSNSSVIDDNVSESSSDAIELPDLDKVMDNGSKRKFLLQINLNKDLNLEADLKIE